MGRLCSYARHDRLAVGGPSPGRLPMLAPVRQRPVRQTAQQRADVRFLQMLPAIRRQASLAFRHCDAEQREELIAAVVANTFLALRRLAARGRLAVARPTPLARYLPLHVRRYRIIPSYSTLHRWCRIPRPTMKYAPDTGTGESGGCLQAVAGGMGRAGPAGLRPAFRPALP